MIPGVGSFEMMEMCKVRIGSMGERPTEFWEEKSEKGEMKEIK